MYSIYADMTAVNDARGRGDDQKILSVGLICLDIINVLDSYPLEDTDTACTGVHGQLWERGGNAANTSIILKQLGVQTEFMGTLARHVLSQLMVEDLQKYGVDINHCVYHANCKPPVSCVIINASSGTRTILHGNRTLPELTYEDFKLMKLEDYKWIHFEGRNIPEVLKMIDRVDIHNKRIKESCHRIQISVEVEKPKWKASLMDLLPKADVVFISKDMARECGCRSGEECVLKFHNSVKQGAMLVCAWGELGAWAIGENGNVVHSAAYPPKRVVDTLGAGDTFNAGVIASLSRGNSLLHAITQGCKVAGNKVGHQGLSIMTDAM